jgi:hypothetical protein
MHHIWSIITQMPLVPMQENLTDGDKTVANMRSNHVAVIRNCRNTRFIFYSNMRLTSIIMQDCIGCRMIMLDSSVITSGIVRLVNCSNCEFTFEDVALPRLKCLEYDHHHHHDCRRCAIPIDIPSICSVENSQVVLISSPPILEAITIQWEAGCQGNQVVIAKMTGIKSQQTRLCCLLGDRGTFGDTCQMIDRNVQCLDMGLIGSEGSKFITWEPMRSYDAPDTSQTTQWYQTTFNELEQAHSFVMADQQQAARTLPQLDAQGIIDAETLGDQWFHSPNLQLTAQQIAALVKHVEDRPFTLSKQELEQAYDAEREELHDSAEELQHKAKQVAAALKAAKYSVVYTVCRRGIRTASLLLH